MVECPDPKCRESIFQKINEECNNIRKCLNQKVSIGILTWSLIAMLSCVGIIAGISYTAYSRGQDEKQERIDNCQEATKSLDKSIAIITNDIEHIKESLQKQDTKQEQILKMLDRIERKSNGRNHD